MNKLCALPCLLLSLVACGPQPEVAPPELPSEMVQPSTSAHLSSLLPAYANTSASPTIASLGNATYLFYKGANEDTGIYVLRTYSPIEEQRWQGLARLPGVINTSDAPAVVTLNNAIYVFYRGAPGDAQIYVVRSTDGTFTWSKTMFPANITTSTRPEPYVSGNSLYVFYKGVNTSAQMFMERLPDNTPWQPL